MKSDKFIFLIFLFLLSQIVSASDFIVEVSNTKQTINPCTSTKFDLKVTNTGAYVNTYSLETVGYSDYFTVSESLFNIKPGEAKQLFIFANFPCEIYGEQSFELLLKSTSSGTKANVLLAVDILKAYDYSISTLRSYDACELLDSTVTLTIKNNADVNNFYSLKVKGVDFVTPKEITISLAAGQESDVLFNFKPGKGTVGNNDLTIISKSIRGEITKKLTTKINVSNCLNPLVFVPTDKSICAEESSFLFEVVNNGSFEETFNFKVSPDFIILEEKNLTLNPGDSKLLTLTISPPPEDNDYLVLLNTTLSNREIDLSQAFNLRVFSPETCYKVYLQKDRLRVGYAEETNNLQVISAGFRHSDYQVSYSGPEWISIEPGSFLLEPGHNFPLLIKSNALNSTLPGLYNFNISLEADNGFSYQESVKLRLGSGIELEQVLLITLIVLVALFVLVIPYLLFRPKKKDKVLKEYIQSKKKIKQFKARKYSKTLFMLLGLVIFGLITFGLYNYLPTMHQVYDFTWSKQLPNESVDLINVSVNDSLFVNGTTYNFSERLSMAIQWIDINSLVSYLNTHTKDISMGILAFFALLIVIAVFLSLKNKKWLFILLLVLILFSLLSQVELTQLSQNKTIDKIEEREDIKESVLIINTSMYNHIKGTFLYHEFEKNTVYKINLSEFFFDPEGEPLVFKTTKPVNIKVSLSDGVLLFSPDLDWIGINSMAIIATDNHGASITSPEIILVVLENKPLSFEELKVWIKINIDLILFTSIIFVIFMIIIINSHSKK